MFVTLCSDVFWLEAEQKVDGDITTDDWTKRETTKFSENGNMLLLKSTMNWFTFYFPE